MNVSVYALWFAVLAVGFAPGRLPAQPRETAAGVLVDDFEQGGRPRGLAVDPREQGQADREPQVLEMVRDEGRGALHLVGGPFHTRVYYQDRSFDDFCLEVRMKKTAGSYAGVVVRDHWRVYFQMRGFLSLNCDLPGEQSKGELFKSAERYTGYHTLKVICAGPMLHAAVDGQPLVSQRIGSGAGRIGFYAHGRGEAYYDEVRITPGAPAPAYLDLAPEASRGALVFSPERPVSLRFRLTNAAKIAQPVTVSVSVRRWNGDAVAGPVTKRAAAGPGGQQRLAFDFGVLPAGFYRLDVRAQTRGETFRRWDDLPLAVQPLGGGPQPPPRIPVAAYYKYYNKRTPLYQRTYAHAAARNLRDHHFNAVVADPSFTPDLLDIFHSYGVAVIGRSARFLDHPAVIAALVSDEPKPDEIPALAAEYARLRKLTDKPIATCLVGDALGLGREGGPLWIWRQLHPDLRAFRWYGVKKSFYGVLHEVKYKPYLPLSSVLRIAEMCDDTPYWVVLPSLGKRDHEAYYHAPTPAEIRAMMHLALAYGADGLLFFAWQSHMAWPCFVDQQSLAPIDDKYAAAAAAAGLIEQHAELLASLEHAGLDIRCPNPVVDAVPRKSSLDERLYVYVVNRDAGRSVQAPLLLWADTWRWTSLRDVYSGREFPVRRDDEGYLRATVPLEPGEGKLLATDAAIRK